MKEDRKPELEALRECVDKILLDVWNPIGGQVPLDEYRRYLPHVIKMVVDEVGEAAITEYLLSVERGPMGLKTNSYHDMRPDTCRRVASRLVSDWEWIQLKYGA